MKLIKNNKRKLREGQKKRLESNNRKSYICNY